MIRIVASPREQRVWHRLLDLAEVEARWVLIGARMVELHALEHGRRLGRASPDGDALGDALARDPNPVRHIAAILLDWGFEVQRASVLGTGHAFVQGDVEIDVLAPESLGRRSVHARTTVPPLHTVEVPGGRQALDRAETVEIDVGGRQGRIRRPNLLGAILIKARAVGVDDVPDSQRQDLALLLSLVEEPDEIAKQLRGGERAWLRRRREMNDPDLACWLGMTPEHAQRGVSALRILADL